eukprot:355571-Chlamydomonas_euryale.AAC.6
MLPAIQSAPRGARAGQFTTPVFAPHMRGCSDPCAATPRPVFRTEPAKQPTVLRRSSFVFMWEMGIHVVSSTPPLPHAPLQSFRFFDGAMDYSAVQGMKRVEGVEKGVDGSLFRVFRTAH